MQSLKIDAPGKEVHFPSCEGNQLAHQNQLHLLIEWKKNEYLPSSESRTLSENLEAISFLLIF